MISLTTLNGLYYSTKPMFVVVCGGIATGKSHVMRKYVTAPYRTIDMDEYMTLLGFTNYDKQGPEWKLAMKAADYHINFYKSFKAPIISQGTGASLHWLKFRLKAAKLDGYATALVHIYAPLHQALAQNEQRRKKGQHFVKPEEISLIRETAVLAQTNFDIVSKDSNLVDYTISYDNTLQN